MYAQTLLGRSVESPQARLFKEYFYPHELVEIPGRGGAVGFRHRSGTGAFKEDTIFSPEEIVAMTLQVRFESLFSKFIFFFLCLLS